MPTAMLPIRTLLSREESYAVHALIAIAREPGTNAAAIAERFDMPKAFMAKVLRRLGEAGLVENRPGRHGGAWLRADPAELSLIDVMEAVSGPFVIDTCQAEARCITQRREGSCLLNRAYHRASAEIRRSLEGVRIADLTG